MRRGPLLRHSLDRGLKLRPLGGKKLASLCLIEGTERPGEIRVSEVEGREHHGAYVHRPPRLRSLFARRLHAGPSKIVAQGYGSLNPIGRNGHRVRKGGRPWLEDSSPNRDALAGARGGHGSLVGHRIAGPVLDRMKVRGDRWALRLWEGL